VDHFPISVLVATQKTLSSQGDRRRMTDYGTGLNLDPVAVHSSYEVKGIIRLDWFRNARRQSINEVPCR